MSTDLKQNISGRFRTIGQRACRSELARNRETVPARSRGWGCRLAGDMLARVWSSD